jgi:hypothetical protein
MIGSGLFPGIFSRNHPPSSRVERRSLLTAGSKRATCAGWFLSVCSVALVLKSFDLFDWSKL